MKLELLLFPMKSNKNNVYSILEKSILLVFLLTTWISFSLQAGEWHANEAELVSMHVGNGIQSENACGKLLNQYER
ncbi:MAG: hypothetical protein WBO44_13110 [Saprospiraceae bacterium]